MPVLWDSKEEKFCHLVVEGKSPAEAAVELGRADGWGLIVVRRQHVAARIRELTERAARNAMLSREEILENVVRQMRLAEQLGQCSAALKASEMLGKEVYRMFVERKELGGPGDFDLASKTEQELKEIIASELKSIGMDVTDPSKQTEPAGEESVKPTNEGTGAVN